MTFVIAIFVSLVLGFGLGRIKDAAKLATVKAEVSKAENAVSAEVKAVVAAIKAKL